MKFRKKKIPVGILVTAFVLLTMPAYAAEYSVHDDEVRSTLSTIKGQIETIQEYLEVIKDKELSMDLLDKTAVERQNESMAKLDGNLSTFMGTGDNSDINLSTILNPEEFNKILKKKNTPNDFIGDLLKDSSNRIGLNLKKMGQSDIMILTTDDIYDMFYPKDKFSSDPKTAKEEAAQYMQSIAEQKLKLQDEYAALLNEKDKNVALSAKHIEEIGEAKSTRQENGLIDKLGGYSGLVDGTTTKTGAILGKSGTDLFKTEGTTSIVATQEKTQGIVAEQLALDVLNSSFKNMGIRLQIRMGELDACEEEVRRRYAESIAEAEKTTIEGMPINRTGERPRRAFEGKYGSYKSSGTGVSDNSGGTGINITDFILH